MADLSILSREQLIERKQLLLRKKELMSKKGDSSETNPLQDSLKMAGDVALGGFKRQMAAGPTSFNTITGGPATEFAHGVKTEGMVRAGVPEMVAESASSATDPQGLLLTMLGGANTLSKMFGKQAASKTAKSQMFTEQLLKPESKEFSKQIRRGGTTPAVEEASKVLKKAKNYTDVTGQLEEASKVPMRQRQNIYENSSSPNNRTQLEPITKEIEDSFQSVHGQKDSQVLKRMMDDENVWLNSQSPEDLANPSFIQARKEELQTLAKPFYDAVSKGADPTRLSARVRGFAALGRGYKDKLSQLSEQVDPLNKQFAGLNDASERASTLAAIERGASPVGIGKELIEAVRPTKEGVIATLVKNTLGRLLPKGTIRPHDVQSLTGNIEKLSKGASKASKASELLANADRPLPKNQLRLMAGERRMLEAPREAIPMEYTGSPSGPTIEMWNDNYMIKPVERVGQPRKPENATLRELMSRRHKNFGGKK